MRSISTALFLYDIELTRTDVLRRYPLRFPHNVGKVSDVQDSRRFCQNNASNVDIFSPLERATLTAIPSNSPVATSAGLSANGFTSAFEGN